MLIDTEHPLIGAKDVLEEVFQDNDIIATVTQPTPKIIS